VNVSAEGLRVDDSGVARCWWAVSSDQYIAYHDDEWGVPVHGETPLYERLTLEAFQSGLSWLTILRKREGFRAAFAGFDAETVASFGEADFERLMADSSIVRNRLKIQAAITNAQAVVRLRDRVGSMSCSGRSRRSAPPTAHAPLTSRRPPLSPLRWRRELKRNGFVFVGPDQPVCRDAGLRAGQRPSGRLLSGDGWSPLR
jgi:DNA-3-methyladenine glycosylase I